MEYRPLGRTGLEVSSIGLGCVTFGREIDKETSFAVLDHALERGINLLDTAEAYAAGESERVVGEWMADRGARDSVVLATKVSGTLTRDRVISSAEESLQRLGVDVIDLFQLHVYDDSTPVDETLGALDTLVEQGKVKHIGCSNWGAWQLAHALLRFAAEGGARMESVQPPYNLVQREIETDLLPLCRDQQVGVLSYSPLGAGFLTGKYRLGQDIPSGTRFDVMPGHQPIYFHDTGWAALGRLDEAAAQTGRSLVDLALSWAIAQSGVTSVLIGCRKLSHVDQAFEAEAAGLPEDVVAHLSADPEPAED
ncbi:MAG: aldo/keto reductase [Planctomycetota bacterium]|nr:aldo/keto reductase [Planctomycetota bacterium]MEC9008427.1 aldo/keto reductase [Planctomycetota bacterium]MED5448051.1 aldo/keto reductase [Planctomycetota bacterium]MEE3283358.1 aldo/keto reductase [Planctomycetota bacterium]MEE3364212.1 aldo/keto reductase [Planctomycetota bacterium]